MDVQPRQECIFLIRERPKTDAPPLDSYWYLHQGKRGGRKGKVWPIAFLNSKGMYFPSGFSTLVARRDPAALRELRKRAQRECRWNDGAQVEQGQTYKVGRNRGGPGGSGKSYRSDLKHKRIDTSCMGTLILLEDFRV